MATTRHDDIFSQSMTQLAAAGLRACLLNYADAIEGDPRAIEFLAEVSEAIDCLLCASAPNGQPAVQ